MESKDLEKDVGIELYLNPENTSISGGTIKHRFSDFIVNEIGLDGKVLYLTTKESNVNDPTPKEEEKVEVEG